MFEFVFEGALLPLTYNGDRFVLFALLPRRKPRTTSVQPPYHSSCRHRVTAFFKEFNLTAAGYSDSRALLGDGMDFMFLRAGGAAFGGRLPPGGFLRAAPPQVLRVTRLDGAGFRFHALCERGFRLRFHVRLGPHGFGSGCATRAFGRGITIATATPDVSTSRFDNRCRTRSPSTKPRAHRHHQRTTETGPQWTRRRRDEDRAPPSSLMLRQYL